MSKATVQFREVSALERVQLPRYKCNSTGSGPNLLSGLESVLLERVDCIANNTILCTRESVNKRKIQIPSQVSAST